MKIEKNESVAPLLTEEVRQTVGEKIGSCGVVVLDQFRKLLSKTRKKEDVAEAKLADDLLSSINEVADGDDVDIRDAQILDVLNAFLQRMVGEKEMKNIDADKLSELLVVLDGKTIADSESVIEDIAKFAKSKAGHSIVQERTYIKPTKPIHRVSDRIKPNDPCPCGSGKNLRNAAEAKIKNDKLKKSSTIQN